MTIDPDLLKSLAESGLLEKVYDDAFAQPVKEVSKIVTWLIKTTQVLCYPLQLGAAYQERLERRIKNAVEKISEENLVKPPESFYVPIVNYLSYIEDGSDSSEAI